MATPVAAISAHTYRRKFPTASQPVLLACGDTNSEYVVKGRQNGRMIVNDHVVAKLGALIAAPVPPNAFIDVPHELITAQAEMSHMPPGIHTVQSGFPAVQNETATSM